MDFANLEIDFLDLSLQVLWLFAHSFLCQEMGSRIILSLHLTVGCILEFLKLVFEVFLVFLQLIVEQDILFEIVLIFRE